MTNEDRVHFGARLRAQREARSLSVPDVVKLTKIPEKSLHHLEDGAFEALPAEVFVRGFIKSYCRAVGLEVEPTLRDYEGLVRERKPKVPSLARLGQMRDGTAPVATAAAAPAAPGAGAAEKDRDREKDKEKEKDDLSIFSALADAGKGTGRMGLTLAVIILVIVATLTLSLLLRRPGRVGDGVSRAEPSEPIAT
jgi:hypothetical protein